MGRRIILGLIPFFIPVFAIAQSAEFLGAYEWRGDGICGMSGLELAADGNSFWAINDKGFIWNGTLARADDGLITGVSAKPPTKIMFFDHGVPLNKPHSDSEGLALGTDGKLFVSFEQIPRVRRIKRDGLSTLWIPEHPDFLEMTNISALEALAIDATGALYMIPERSGKLTRPFPVCLATGRDWDIPFHIPRRGQYLPVGADFGPYGRLFLLERRFLGISGFQNSVRAFSIEDDNIIDEVVIFQSETAVHDNLEGIAVWRDSDGATRLTMI